MKTTRSIAIVLTLLLASAALGSVTAAPATPGPATPMGQIEAVLKLSAQEKDALFATQAIPTADFDTAVYMLLNKATQLPQLATADFERLFRPDYDALLTNPDAYAGRPIRLDIYLGEVVEFTSGTDLTPSADWPAGQSVWVIRGYNADSESGQQGVLIYSVVDPLPFLPKATETKEKEGRTYHRWSTTYPVQLSVAGVFVKVFQAGYQGADYDAEADRDAEQYDFPLVVVWQVVDPAAVEAEMPTNWRKIITTGLIAFLAIVGLGVFVFMSKKIRQSRPSAMRHGIAHLNGYKSLRDDGAGPAEQEFAPEDEDADAIDPALKAAVEDWKKDHHEPAD